MNFNTYNFESAHGTAANLPPSTLPEIAFAGRSNVGKSSLLNKILNRKSLARTSSVPGKTVTVNFYHNGDPASPRLADLPGYGFARVSQSEKKRWAELMEGYFNSGPNIALVVQLTDMRRPPTPDDHDMLKFLKAAGRPFIVVMTKSDKLNKTERRKRMEEAPAELAYLGEVKAIPFSAVTGEGTEEIKEAIRRAVL